MEPAQARERGEQFGTIAARQRRGSEQRTCHHTRRASASAVRGLAQGRRSGGVGSLGGRGGVGGLQRLAQRGERKGTSAVLAQHGFEDWLQRRMQRRSPSVRAIGRIRAPRSARRARVMHEAGVQGRRARRRRRAVR